MSRAIGFNFVQYTHEENPFCKPCNGTLPVICCVHDIAGTGTANEISAKTNSETLRLSIGMRKLRWEYLGFLWVAWRKLSSKEAGEDTSSVDRKLTIAYHFPDFEHISQGVAWESFLNQIALRSPDMRLAVIIYRPSEILESTLRDLRT